VTAEPRAPGAPGDDDVEIALEAAQVDGAAGVGRVVAAGARAGGLIDRRVLVGPSDPCGECEICRRGGAAVCPLARRHDARGETLIAAARWLVPLGDGLDVPLPAAAAVAGDVATAYTLYARTGIAPREPVVVIGGSPIGRFLIEILLAKGIAPAAIASDGAWADWLRGKGAIVAASRAELAERFARGDHGARPWRVMCADPAACATAAELAGPRATLTVLAPPRHRSERSGLRDGAVGDAVIPGHALAREISVIGVAGPHPDLVVEVAAMCVKAEIDVVAGTSLAADALRTHVRTAP
jgi:D-arabinose 1-dehydrogenase-like Zn-dependent alcohol dehydrogenase